MRVCQVDTYSSQNTDNSYINIFIALIHPSFLLHNHVAVIGRSPRQGKKRSLLPLTSSSHPPHSSSLARQPSISRYTTEPQQISALLRSSQKHRPQKQQALKLSSRPLTLSTSIASKLSLNRSALHKHCRVHRRQPLLTSSQPTGAPFHCTSSPPPDLSSRPRQPIPSNVSLGRLAVCRHDHLHRHQARPSFPAITPPSST